MTTEVGLNCSKFWTEHGRILVQTSRIDESRQMVLLISLRDRIFNTKVRLEVVAYAKKRLVYNIMRKEYYWTHMENETVGGCKTSSRPQKMKP